MATFRKTYQKGRYDFRDQECIGLGCWAPGEYQVRGATSSGSRNTGSARPCCLRRAYHGCPSDDSPERATDQELVKIRRAEGWKVTR